MANNNGGLPKNFDRIGNGKVETIPDILDRGSEGNVDGNQWQNFLKNRDGIEPSKEPISNQDNKEQEITKEQDEPEKDI